MTDIKYALGMGEVDYLNDGVYPTLDEAHAEALRLKNLPHDNGDYHLCYLIGEIASSSSIAIQNSNSITQSVIEHLAEQIEQLEPFDGIFDSYIKVDDDGKTKIEAVLKDVLANHTKYPKSEVVKEVKTYNFTQKNAQVVPCPYCKDRKEITPTAAQIEGKSKRVSVQCKDCEGFFTAVYNTKNGSLIAETIRL